MEFGGSFSRISQNSTVESGSGGCSPMEQDLAHLFVHAGPLGKSSVAGKVSPSAPADAVMAGGGRVSHGSAGEQPRSSQQTSRGPGHHPSDS